MIVSRPRGSRRWALTHESTGKLRASCGTWASTKGDHGLWIGVMRSIMRAATAASRPSACKAALYR